MIRRATAIVLFLIAAAACGFAADARLDVSSVIDKATAESLLGEPVKPTTPRNLAGADGYYSKCNYYTVKPGKALIIRLRQAAAGSTDPQQELEMVRASTGPTKLVPGLGDRAEYSHGTESNLPPHGLMLYIAKGSSLITVGLNGMDDDSLALDKARSAAQKILDKL